MAKATRIAERIISIDDHKLGKRAPGEVDRSSIDNELNRSIISMLQQDGRMAFSEIAQELNVSEGTIRNRVNSMKQAGMLRIVAVVDPVVAEYTTDAMVGLKVAPNSKPQDVAQRLAELSEIIYVLWVGGRYDLLIEVVCHDRNQFLEFMETHIHGQADIASIETMPGLHNFKNQFLLKDE